MKELSTFKSLDRPWEIPDRLDRMRYLVSHLVWKDAIWQAFSNDDWFVAKSKNGEFVIPLWPTKESAQLSLSSSETFVLKSISVSTIEVELFSKMYDDELVAAFPNVEQEYELLTVAEFRQSLRYIELLKLGHEDTLDESGARELTQFLTFNRPKA